MGAELTEKTIPAETGLIDLTVSFTKGCYTGQELVARIDSRGGHVPRHLCRLFSTDPLSVGAQLTGSDGKEVATVTSVARTPDGGWIGLGYVRRGVDLPTAVRSESERDRGGDPGSDRMNARGTLVAVVGMAAALLFGAGCSNVQSLSFPSPTGTVATSKAAASTLPDNLSSVLQPSVAGATTTTLPAIRPGAATLNGSVFGPSGPVGGATVEADRVVGDQVASALATTAADGSWRIAGILGGVYRVRAWHAPNLAVTTPQLLFLGDSQDLTVSLELTSFPGPNVGVAITPAAPYVGQPANLLVQITNPTIGADGVLSYQPVAADRVQLTPGSGWSVSGPNPATTDASGNAVFQVQCRVPGSSPLIATVGTKGTPVPLQVPPCAPAPAPTTSTTAPCPSTTTAPPAKATSTTVGAGACG